MPSSLWESNDVIVPVGSTGDAGAATVGIQIAVACRALARGYAGGTELSGGQWQRVALARALCAVALGAGLVLLDEPTAQLDVRGEAEIFDRILAATRQATTVLISHRFSTVRHADSIAVIENGRVNGAVLSHGGETRNVQASLVVGADGRHSRVARLVVHLTPRRPPGPERPRSTGGRDHGRGDPSPPGRRACTRQSDR